MSSPLSVRLGLPGRLALITGLLAVLLVAGASELALFLAERSRLEDLREESVDLATTLAAYLSRIAPSGEPSALAVGLAGWSRRHITETTAMAFVRDGAGLAPAAASDSTVTREPDDLDAQVMSRETPGVRFRHHPSRSWQVVVPLGRRHPWGVLDVRVSTGRLEEWARLERRRAYLLACAAAVLLAGGVALLMSRWVGVPLRALSGAMAGAHGGATNAPAAPEIGAPEFRAVARGYNELRDALAHRERESAARAGLLALAERSRSLERQAQAEEILGSLSHEIGTPLNTMGGHLQLLGEDLRHARDTVGEERVDLMRKQLDRVTTIVREGLRRGEWPDPRPRTVDLGDVVGSLLRFLEPSLERTGVTASVTRDGNGQPLLALTDPDLVEQILLNLLKNANEALGPGGRISVVIGLEGGQAFIDVADDGPGLPAVALSQLFQPFVTSKGPAGVGLGLAVSRRLARSLNGELIHIPSGQGTRWRLTLPIPKSN